MTAVFPQAIPCTVCLYMASSVFSGCLYIACFLSLFIYCLLCSIRSFSALFVYILPPLFYWVILCIVCLYIASCSIGHSLQFIYIASSVPLDHSLQFVYILPPVPLLHSRQFIYILPHLFHWVILCTVCLYIASCSIGSFSAVCLYIASSVPFGHSALFVYILPPLFHWIILCTVCFSIASSVPLDHSLQCLFEYCLLCFLGILCIDYLFVHCLLCSIVSLPLLVCTLPPLFPKYSLQSDCILPLLFPHDIPCSDGADLIISLTNVQFFNPKFITFLVYLR